MVLVLSHLGMHCVTGISPLEPVHLEICQSSSGHYSGNKCKLTLDVLTMVCALKCLSEIVLFLSIVKVTNKVIIDRRLFGSL